VKVGLNALPIYTQVSQVRNNNISKSACYSKSLASDVVNFGNSASVFEHSDGAVFAKAVSDGHRQGSMSYYIEQRDFIPGASKTAPYYKGVRNLCVNTLFSFEKGVGTKLMQEAVRLSQKMGCEGRVMLTASALGSNATTPVPFYSKLGFKAFNQVLQNEIEAAMEAYKTTGTYDGPDDTVMYLPKENIAALLAK